MKHPEKSLPLTGRAHPVMIAENLWRVFYLIIFPVLRGFVTALQGGFASWLSGAWFDLLTLLLMASIAVLVWRRCVYRCDVEAIEVSAGLFFTRRTVIKWDHVASLSCKTPLLLRPFHAALLRADTLGGDFRGADIRLWLSHSDADRLMDIYRASRHDSGDAAILRRYSPSLHSVLAFSVLNSNSLGGIVFLAAFISQTGRLLGNEFSDLLVGTFEEATRAFALGAPPAAAAIAYALLIGWLIGFLSTVLLYIRLGVSLANGKLLVGGGYMTKRTYALDVSRIHFIDIRQTVVTKWLGYYTLFLSAVGYGKHKDDIVCLLPTLKASALRAECERFFPAFTPSERQLRPNPKAAFAYLYPCLYYLLLLAALTTLFLFLFPSWNTFILFVALMLLIPGFLFLLVRYTDFKTAGISKQNGHYTIRYSHAFQLHTIVLPEDKIVKISIHQGIFQRKRGNCNVTLYSPAERRALHRCRSLSLNEAIALFHISW